MAELSAELLSSVLAAGLSDDVKAARLSELLDQMKANEAILAEARRERAAASDDLAQARAERKAAEQAKAEAAAHEARLQASEDGLRAAITGHNATMASFSEIRHQIEANLKARGDALAAGEADYERRLAELVAREESVQRVHHDVVAARDSLRRRHARLETALDDNAAEEAAAA